MLPRWLSGKVRILEWVATSFSRFSQSMGNVIDRGAWRATVHGIVKSWTQLSN